MYEVFHLKWVNNKNKIKKKMLWAPLLPGSLHKLILGCKEKSTGQGATPHWAVKNPGIDAEHLGSSTLVSVSSPVQWESWCPPIHRVVVKIRWDENS